MKPFPRRAPLSDSVSPTPRLNLLYSKCGTRPGPRPVMRRGFNHESYGHNGFARNPLNDSSPQPLVIDRILGAMVQK